MAAPTRTWGRSRPARPPETDPAAAEPATLEDTLDSARHALAEVDGPPDARARTLHTWWQTHRSTAERAGHPVLPFATLALVAPEDVFALAFGLHFDAATGRTAPR